MHREVSLNESGQYGNATEGQEGLCLARPASGDPADL